MGRGFRWRRKRLIPIGIWARLDSYPPITHLLSEQCPTISEYMPPNMPPPRRGSINQLRQRPLRHASRVTDSLHPASADAAFEVAALRPVPGPVANWLVGLLGLPKAKPHVTSCPHARDRDPVLPNQPLKLSLQFLAEFQLWLQIPPRLPTSDHSQRKASRQA